MLEWSEHKTNRRATASWAKWEGKHGNANASRFIGRGNPMNARLWRRQTSWDTGQTPATRSRMCNTSVGKDELPDCRRLLFTSEGPLQA